MKRLALLYLTFFSCISCQENAPSSALISYVNLNDATASKAKSFSLDIDMDGDTEYLFTTVLTADATGDLRQFVVSPARENQVFEIARRVGVLESGQEIAPGNPFDKNVQPMAVKRITNTATSWSGDWKDVSNKYIGIRFKIRDKGYYYGWIRVSFDKETERIVIHDFAYKIAENSGIKAGVK
jgi:hypothetical protein